MWINKKYFERSLEQNDALQVSLSQWQNAAHTTQAHLDDARTQKAKDDMTIDWMRHRINALEKQNAILLQKAAGVTLPVPEIVPTRPGSMTAPSFDSLPSFEDVGDEEAVRLKLSHDELGFLQFKDEPRSAIIAARNE